MKIFLVAALLSSVFCQVSSQGHFRRRPPGSTTRNPNRRPIFFNYENSTVDFALNLHRTLVKTGKSDENLIFSPISIVSVLNLMMAGAVDQTYGEMRNVLKYPLNLEDKVINKAYHDILGKLLEPGRGVDITLANGLFYDRTVDLDGEFNYTALNEYRVKLDKVDFTYPVSVKNHINDWVSKSTRGLIKSLLKSPLSPESKLAIVNAVYFKGRWLFPFHPTLTRVAPFIISPKETVSMNMMINILDVPITTMNERNIRCTMMGLPYEGTGFGIFFILPEDEGINGLEHLERHLKAYHIIKMIKTMYPERVTINIPRLKESMRRSMVPVLDRMGLTTAFKPYLGKFKRLSQKSNIAFNALVHQAEMEVNEKGTEAAAASAVTLDRGGTSRSFRANRPFLFFIRDNVTGMPLFWGRIVRPSSA